MSHIMTFEEFEETIAAYGSKPQNWPRDKADAMARLADAEPRARALIQQAADLDQALDARLPDKLEALEQAILNDMNAVLGQADIIAFPHNKSTGRHFIWSAATALAACFVGGFIAAPLVLDFMTGGVDLMASLDIISDAFLPTEPL